MIKALSQHGVFAFDGEIITVVLDVLAEEFGVLEERGVHLALSWIGISRQAFLDKLVFAWDFGGAFGGEVFAEEF